VFLERFRFPVLFGFMADSLAGYLGTCADVRTPYLLALLAISSASLQALGTALDNVMDRAGEGNTSPDRLLPSGRIPVRARLILATGALISSACALLLAETTSESRGPRLTIWVCLVIAILVYYCHSKNPVLMGVIRALNFVLGIATAGSIKYFEPLHLILLPTPLFVYGAATAYISCHQGMIKSRLWVAVAIMMTAAIAGASWSPLLQFGIWTIKDSYWREIAPFYVNWPALGTGTLLAFWLYSRAYRAQRKEHIAFLSTDCLNGMVLLDATYLISRSLYFEGLAIAAFVIPGMVSGAILNRRGGLRVQ
jgi:hypothetical protein